MKIKSIANLCKKSKHVVLFERVSEDGELIQYIGDGAAVYPLAGLPPLDKESVLTIFDVPEKQRGEWLVETMKGAPKEINFDDFGDNERIVEPESIQFVYHGAALKPVVTSRGLVFIDGRYLSPVSDMLDAIELYERFTSTGTPYIVAKAGLLLCAVIMPVDVVSPEFTARLRTLAKECETSLALRKQEAEERAKRDSEAQTEFEDEEGVE